MRVIGIARRQGQGFRVFVVCLFLLLALPLGVASRPVAGPRPASPDLSNSRVLVLHSYHQGFTWTDNISRGIQSAFAGHAHEVEVIFEFMDARRIYSDEHFRHLLELYRLKYAGQKIDVIVASDDQAFNFVLGLGQEIFAGMPIVFASVSGYEPSMRQGRQLTGLQEAIDIGPTLDVALQLHPDTREVAVITDMTRTGQALKAKAEAVFQHYEDRVRFRYLEHETVDELLPQVSALSEGTIVFLFIFSRDQSGRVISHEHRLRVLAGHCQVPIYSVWEFYAGHGIVGGLLTSGEEEGRMAGQMALRILQGESALDIPLQRSPSRYVFDHAQLERFDIEEVELPEGSVVINKPYSIYEEYRPLIWGVGVVILLLLVIVAFLVRTVAMRRRAEETLRRERDLQSRIMATSPVGITVVDVQGQITFANEQAEEVLGLTKDRITGRTYNDPEWRITSYDGSPFPDEELPFSRVMATAQPVYGVRHAIQWSDGRRVLLSINAAPLLAESGGVDGMVAMVQDVTGQIHAEQALLASEKKFRNIIESIPMGMHMYELQAGGRLVFTGANPAADEILGVDNSRFIGQTIEEAFPVLVETEVPERYRLAASAGETWHTAQIDYEGNEIAGAFEVYVFQTSPGRMVAAFLDVTERIRYQEEIRRLNEELEQRVIERTADLTAVNEELEAFAYSVSHDLRAPLRSIDGFSHALLEDYGHRLDPDGRDYLRRVRAASQRMGRLIEDLLKLSRLTRSEMYREAVDLSRLAHEIAAELGQREPERQVEFAIAEGLVAHGDARLLRVILENLLDNAWKFTGKQTCAKIEFGCTRHDDKLVYFVRDNGAGFDMAYADRLFGAFQRLHSVAEFEGTGIGLVTVQRIIHRHGGRVWAEGAVGQGAAVYFTLAA